VGAVKVADPDLKEESVMKLSRCLFCACLALAPFPARAGAQPAEPKVKYTIRGHTNGVVAVAFSPDAKLLATGGKDKSIRVWDMQTGDRIERILHRAEVYALAFSPDGKVLASGGRDGAVTLWDTGKEYEAIRTSTGMGNSVVRLAFSPDGESIAAVGHESSIVPVFEVSTGKKRFELKGHSRDVRVALFSPDGKRLITGSADSSIRLWDSRSGKQLDSLRAHDKDVSALAFTADGKMLLSGSSDGSIIRWDLKKGNPIKPALEDKFGVVLLGCTPDGRVLSRNVQFGLKVWDVRGKQHRVLRKDHAREVIYVGKYYAADLAISPGCRLLAVADGQNIIVSDLGPFAGPPGGRDVSHTEQAMSY
jgi:WD40 repeat protein